MPLGLALKILHVVKCLFSQLSISGRLGNQEPLLSRTMIFDFTKWVLALEDSNKRECTLSETSSLEPRSSSLTSLVLLARANLLNLRWLQMELTLMMVAERPIPLKQLRENFLSRQIQVLSTLPKGSDNIEQAQMSNAHALALARIKRHCTGCYNFPLQILCLLQFSRNHASLA